MSRFNWDSRVNGMKPEYFPNVRVVPSADEYQWTVFSDHKKKKIYTVKEQSSKHKHLYVNVQMVVNGEVYQNRGMPLAQLIWLKVKGMSILPGCVIDHIDENPMNNLPNNLQMLTIGDNTRKSWRIKKNQKN